MIKTSSLLFLALFLFSICVPGTARATVSPEYMTDPVNSANCQGMAAASAANYQRKVSKINDIAKLFPVLSLDSYCWSKMNQMFNTLLLFASPKKLAVNIALSILKQYSNQVCSIVISVSNQISQFAMSQLNSICVPLPTLGANLGSFNLGLKPAPRCQGIPLMRAGTMTNMPNPQWSPDRFFRQGQ